MKPQLESEEISVLPENSVSLERLQTLDQETVNWENTRMLKEMMKRLIVMMFQRASSEILKLSLTTQLIYARLGISVLRLLR